MLHTMGKWVEKGVLIGLGLSWKGKEWVDELVRKGEENPSELAKRIRGLAKKVEEEGSKLEGRVGRLCEDTLKRVKVPTRADFERLEREVADLASRLKPSR